MSVLILDKDYQELLNLRRKSRSNKKIKEKNKELQKRINDAIEFIKEFDYYIPEDDKPELLDILEGKANND